MKENFCTPFSCKKTTLSGTFFYININIVLILKKIQKKRFCLKFSFCFNNYILKRSLLFSFQIKTTSLVFSFSGFKKRKRNDKPRLFVFQFEKTKTKRQQTAPNTLCMRVNLFFCPGVNCCIHCSSYVFLVILTVAFISQSGPGTGFYRLGSSTRQAERE